VYIRFELSFGSKADFRKIFPSRNTKTIFNNLPLSVGAMNHSEIESFSETNGADGRAEGFGDFIDTPMCQAVNAPDRR